MATDIVLLALPKLRPVIVTDALGAIDGPFTYIVMAYTVMAYTVMAYIVMASAHSTAPSPL